MHFFDAFGRIFLFWIRMIRKKNPAKRILVLRLDQIGDMVQVLPFLSSLRKKYPEHEIHAVCVKDCAFLLADNPDVDRVHECGSSWFYKGRNRRYAAVFSMAKQLRELNFEMCFDLRGDVRNIFFLRLCMAGILHAYGCAGGDFMIDVMPEYDRDEHEIDKNLKFIGEKAGEDMRINFPVSRDDEKEAESVINAASNKKIAVIHPFSRAASKMWGFDNFAEIMKRFIEAGFLPVIIGGREDRQEAEKLSLKTGAVNAAGLLKISSSIALIKKAEIFVGNDSGPQYFAAYSGVKTCVIYGFTVNSKRWKPKVGDNIFAGISIPVSCGPCEKALCDSKAGHICMDIIKPDMVWEKIQELLSR